MPEAPFGSWAGAWLKLFPLSCQFVLQRYLVISNTWQPLIWIHSLKTPAKARTTGHTTPSQQLSSSEPLIEMEISSQVIKKLWAKHSSTCSGGERSLGYVCLDTAGTCFAYIISIFHSKHMISDSVMTGICQVVKSLWCFLTDKLQGN